MLRLVFGLRENPLSNSSLIAPNSREYPFLKGFIFYSRFLIQIFYKETEVNSPKVKRLCFYLIFIHNSSLTYLSNNFILILRYSDELIAAIIINFFSS